jgi:hypothetical protein
VTLPLASERIRNVRGAMRASDLRPARALELIAHAENSSIWSSTELDSDVARPQKILTNAYRDISVTVG